MNSLSQHTTQISPSSLGLPTSDFDSEDGVSTPKVLRIHPVDAGAGLISIDSQPFVFGREKSCSVTIQDDSASRRHSEIVQQGDDWYIVDLNSTNGTWVNEQRIQSQKLHAGDCIRVGRWTYKYFDKENMEASYHESVYQMMTQDSLTGAWNRRYLDDVLKREICHHKRTGQPICLLMIDLDHFKTINDEHGHQVGDDVLAEFGKRIQSCIRVSDIFCRFGGDEFAVLMVNSDRQSSGVVCDRIMKSINSEPFATSVGDIECSISCGFAQCTIDNSLTVEEFIALADKRLYEAKKTGRQKIIG